MKTSLLRRTALTATAALAVVMVSGQAQSAGLFDFLFGGFAPPPAPSYAPPGYGRSPLDVRVNPRRKMRPGSGQERGAAAPRGRHDNEPRRKTATQQPIDPVKNPNWYLEDPTLRRGDIVVLKSGILVFDGGARTRSREDFTSLDKSRLISKTDRERLKKAAPIVADAEEPSLPTQKAASLQNSAE